MNFKTPVTKTLTAHKVQGPSYQSGFPVNFFRILSRSQRIKTKSATKVYNLYSAA
jgi:hypothetical protein